MRANRVTILALTTALALAGPSLRAQASHRGGGGSPGASARPSGGGHPGGGYAVPRGSAPAHPGSPSRGGVAAARHPRAGTGSSYYRPGYGGYYRPYYRNYYYGYPYYRPSLYASFYFGWPYAYAGWWPYGYYWPYGYHGYYSPNYSVSYYGYRDVAPDRSYDAPSPLRSHRDVGRVRLEVRPEDASIYVDDEFRGNGRETKYLALSPGRHAIELVRPGFEVARREVEVARGETADVLVELRQP